MPLALMHKQFNTSKLTLEQKRFLCQKFHEICDRWWVDVLDCSKSPLRKTVEMPFEKAMELLDQSALFFMFHRYNPPTEDYIEVGFRSGTNPEYFLWIQSDLSIPPPENPYQF